MYWLYAVIGFAVMIALLGLLMAESRREASAWLDDFQAHFPGRCPICAYYRHGLQAGLNPAPPGPHDCPEEPV